MTWCAVQVNCWRPFHDFARVHHHDVVGLFDEQGKIMSDEDHGEENEKARVKIALDVNSINVEKYFYNISIHLDAINY